MYVSSPVSLYVCVFVFVGVMLPGQYLLNVVQHCRGGLREGIRTYHFVSLCVCTCVFVSSR